MRVFSPRKKINKNYIGLELGRQFVRLMILEKTNVGYIPVAHDEVALSSNSDNDCILWNELREALTILKERNPIDKAHVVIPQSDAFVLQDEVEDVQYLQNVIYKNLPFAPQELEYDVATQGNVVTIIAIHKNIFAEYVRLLSEFNIKPLSIQTENQAITRVASVEGESQSIISINVSSRRTVITLSKNGLPYECRTVFHDLINTFSEEDEVAKAWRKAVSKVAFLVYEKEGTMQQYSQKEVFISGDIARSKIDSAIIFLEGSIGNSHINPIPIWQHCFNTEDYIPPIFQEDSLRYSNVLGAAITETL